MSTERVAAFDVDDDGVPLGYLLHCPGCEVTHLIHTREPNAKGARWEFNGNMGAPTFAPSLLVEWPGAGGSKKRCHSFIRDGRIEFLNDSTHSLAGKTVMVPIWT